MYSTCKPAAQTCEGARKLPSRVRKEAWPPLLSGRVWGAEALYRTEGPAVEVVSNLMAFGTHKVQRKIAKLVKIGRKSCKGQGEKERSSGSQRTLTSHLSDKDSKWGTF